MLKETILKYTPENKLGYSPYFFRIHDAAEKQALEQLLSEGNVLFVHDEIYSQLQELVKCLSPSVRIKAEEYEARITAHLNGRSLEEYGVWVYYPWSRRLVHLLDEDEFVMVRTNRNQFKITREEQNLLKEKKIGIVGLSVGQSIALTMAMERTCGELRLADFDVAELSNLNRLRTGLHNMGTNKTIIAAREILEIDPFIKIKLFHDGLNKSNMDQFFTEDGKLDLFIEVCDGIDIKIESRYKARELNIPVVMDTNDRGMLDVERFDLEPGRPILHGLADGLDPGNIKDLSNEEKIPYILKMVGAETISTRLKASMMEVEQSINTWPQLASSVVLGGALTTDVCRRILLDQFHESGRYYVDMDELVKDQEPETGDQFPESYIAPPELTAAEMLQLTEAIEAQPETMILPAEVISEIVNAGMLAPSGGNAQPWKFVYSAKGLFIFHDAHFSHSLLDFNHLGSYVAIGAAVENITIKAAALGLSISNTFFPLKDNRTLAAHIRFAATEKPDLKKILEPGLGMRVTNRELAAREALPQTFYDQVQSAVAAYPGAGLTVIEDDNMMKKLGELLAKAEMLRIIHPRGHYDTFTNELRWTAEETNEKRDGLDVYTLGASNSELAALKIASDTKAITFLRQLKGGNAFTRSVNKSVSFSSALGIVTMPGYSEMDFLRGGSVVERIWLEANLAGVSFQPISQLVFMLARLEHGEAAEGDEFYNEQVRALGEQLDELLPELRQKQPVFIFRLSKAGEPKMRSLRRSLQSSFIYHV
ncbi:Nitroreductase family protein [Pedobacter westerhofensis]|uniref:Nitroreductase family protein n=1 Tax=Pedobacter westerhofensis TaxID=425512 RepID=A0A521AVB5_9SPHI|nr:Rv1355c family protein [Pedobacter westerhofensis]SMO38783.1 Nitroreductase family protein [Pedobacter westerhofensis]